MNMREELIRRTVKILFGGFSAVELLQVAPILRKTAERIVDANLDALMEPSNNCEFGATLNDMDVEAFLNARGWLEQALKTAGATITDAGMGAGRADVGFMLDGAPFAIQLRPRKFTAAIRAAKEG